MRDLPFRATLRNHEYCSPDALIKWLAIVWYADLESDVIKPGMPPSYGCWSAHAGLSGLGIPMPGRETSPDRISLPFLIRILRH